MPDKEPTQGAFDRDPYCFVKEFFFCFFFLRRQEKVEVKMKKNRRVMGCGIGFEDKCRCVGRVIVGSHD